VWPALLLAAISFDLRDADGRRHTLGAARESRAVVILFLAPDCPLSNRYSPEIRQLWDGYHSRDVLFYGVGAEPGRFPFPALVDPENALAQAVGTRVTPSAAVLTPAGDLLYRGRIDDRVVTFGQVRPRPRRADLRLVLDRILQGRPVQFTETSAIGCDIPWPRREPRTPVTFTRDVAPILYRHCAACHRPGEVGPFSLLTYEDARRRAGVISQVVARRYMPPWKPAPGYGKFQGERTLTASEIETIQRWAEGGAPEGNPADTPALPRFPEGWRLGPPDLVARMPKPFAVAAEGEDIYQCFVVPLNLDKDRYVRALEFQPGNRRLVHHALLFADPAGVARKKGATYPCFGAPGFLPARGLGGWTPGMPPITLPDGAQLTLPKSSDLVLQLHFHPTGRIEQEQSSVAFYFSDTPPTRRLLDVPLGSNRIDIPAGERAYQVRDQFTLPVDVEVIGIIPHAHYICKDMKGVAVLPDSSRRWLLWIPDWDFNWQDQYRYETPLRLPAGTRLEMEFTYDNSAANPRNPNQPPQRVVWGPDSTDEMAGLHVQVIPVRREDTEELTQALWGRMMRALGGRVGP
jgi:hypothetical protein